MKIITLLFCIFSIVCIAQNTQFEKAYKTLILGYYNDSIFQKTGSLLPLPDELKNNEKRNIIYIKSNPRFATNNNIAHLEKNIQIIFKCDTNINNSINKVNLFLLKEQIIDTFYNNSKNYKFNLMGRLIINNIYVRKKYNSNTFNEIFFEVIRSGPIYRDQSEDLIYLIKVHGKWQIKNRRQLGMT